MLGLYRRVCACARVREQYAAGKVKSRGASVRACEQQRQSDGAYEKRHICEEVRGEERGEMRARTQLIVQKRHIRYVVHHCHRVDIITPTPRYI